MLLTTLPGEQHGIGLLMVEALLVPETAQCISLGVQTPLDDIRRAALAHKVQVIALSFSTAFPVRQASESLATLRRQLPPDIALWAGGDMIRRIRKTLPGVLLIPDLAGVAVGITEAIVREWHRQTSAVVISLKQRVVKLEIEIPAFVRFGLKYAGSAADLALRSPVLT